MRLIHLLSEEEIADLSWRLERGFEIPILSAQRLIHNLREARRGDAAALSDRDAARAEVEADKVVIDALKFSLNAARAEVEELRQAQRNTALALEGERTYGLRRELDADRAEVEALRAMLRECREAIKPLTGCSDPVTREEFRPLLQRIEETLKET